MSQISSGPRDNMLIANLLMRSPENSSDVQLKIQVAPLSVFKSKNLEEVIDSLMFNEDTISVLSLILIKDGAIIATWKSELNPIKNMRIVDKSPEKSFGPWFVLTTNKLVPSTAKLFELFPK